MSKTKRFLWSLLLLIFLSHSVSWLLPMPVAAADLEIIDKVKVKFQGRTFIDRNPYDDENNFKANPSSDCSDQIIMHDLAGGNASATVEINRPPNSSGDGCRPGDKTEIKRNAIGGDYANRMAAAYRIAENKIYLPIGIGAGDCNADDADQSGTHGDSSYLLNPDGVSPARLFRRPPENDDQYGGGNKFLKYDDKKGAKLDQYIYITTSDGGKDGALYSYGDCDPSGNHNDKKVDNIAFAGDGKITQPPEAGYGKDAVDKAEANSNPSDGPNDTSDTQCDAGSVFTWAVCGLISFAVDAMEWIQRSVIEPFLTVSPLTRTSTTSDGDVIENPVFGAWKQLRTLANVLLVPIFIVIIYSQAIGGGRE